MKSSRDRPKAVIPIAARRHPFVTKLDRNLKRLLGNDNGRLVIGVSGGADSVALLLGCVAISQRKDSSLEPVVVHVNHHMRDGAQHDAEWVQKLCAHFQVECHVEDAYPNHLTGNMQANARALRYDALIQAAERCNAKHIAVAHHADDQFETILMSLCRGAGLEGLSGMAESTSLTGEVSLIRPMLSVTREECEQFCRVADIEWRDDPSNQDMKYARVRLRRGVIPILEGLWPGAAQRVIQTSNLVGAARTVLEQQLESTFGYASTDEWDRARLRSLPPELIVAGLRRAALEKDRSIADKLTHEQLKDAARCIHSNDRTPHEFHLPAGLKLKVTSKRVLLEPLAP